LAYGRVYSDVLERCCRGLQRVTDLLSAGDGAQARIRAVLLGLPEIDAEGMNRLALAAALRKFNPRLAEEARLPMGGPGAGEWSDGSESDEAGDNLVPTAMHVDSTEAMKQRFVEAHLAAAQKAADELGVPVENILVISALESGWGTSSAAAHNNYFGLQYPAPFATGSVQAQRNKKVRLATFASYADSASAFVSETKSIVQGRSDPETFAAALQNSGKFGIDTTTGAKVTGYVDDVAATIKKLRPIIVRSKA
jgi:hypothetical protein